MNSHQLSIDIVNIANPNSLYIVDTSKYINGLPVSCNTLEIQAPGFEDVISIEVESGFTLSLNACDLELQLHNCGNTSNPLPDGIYIIRYSIKPNDEVYVEYNHLRTTKLDNKIYDILCCLDVAACEPQGDLKEKLSKLNLLRTMLLAAKSNVEFCHHPNKGMEIYKYVQKELNKLACGCGCLNCCD